MLLTIGTAVYDDYAGLEATVQALRLYQDLSDCELLVVDNHPDSDQGRRSKALVDWANGRECPARYIDMPTPVGTSAPRDRVFREAAGEAVVCMDSHVMTPPGTVARLKQFYRDNPDTRDLHSGPMLNYGLEIYGTHFADLWRAEMWGVWGQAWLCPCGSGKLFDVHGERQGVPDGIIGMQMPDVCGYHALRMGFDRIQACETCGRPLPLTLGYARHERALESLGYRRLGWRWPEDEPPFEIPGMGLGLFSCRKDAWLGFHPAAQFFGGEELYIHGKYRAAGHRAICHPWLRWWHRFGRPCGDGARPPYPLTVWGKVRNYVLEFAELGWDPEPIRKHFVEDAHKISDQQWAWLLENPVEHVKWADTSGASKIQILPGAQKTYGRSQPPGGATIDEVYRWTLANPRDLQEHFPKVRELAVQCSHVTAFTKRREWLPVLVAARPANVISHCTEHDEIVGAVHAIVNADTSERRVFNLQTTDFDSLAVPVIPETDLLILAQVHTADRVYEELSRFAPQVRRWIVVQGTSTFGEAGEGGRQGLLPGCRKYMQEHPEWRRVYQADNQYGLTVLSRDSRERSIDMGPGTELHGMFEQIGISATASCGCRAMSRNMDAWGAAGCEQHFDEIVKWLQDNRDKYGWGDKFRAAAGMVWSGLFAKVNWLDPFPGLVKEAIRRAEIKEREWQASQTK